MIWTKFRSKRLLCMDLLLCLSGPISKGIKYRPQKLVCKESHIEFWRRCFDHNKSICEQYTTVHRIVDATFSHFYSGLYAEFPCRKFFSVESCSNKKEDWNILNLFEYPSFEYHLCSTLNIKRLNNIMVNVENGLKHLLNVNFQNYCDIYFENSSVFSSFCIFLSLYRISDIYHDYCASKYLNKFMNHKVLLDSLYTSW